MRVQMLLNDHYEIRVIAALILLCGPALAQRDLAAEYKQLTNTHEIRATAEAERKLQLDQSNEKLRAIDVEWRKQRDQLSRENSQAWRDIQNNWSTKLKELSASKLAPDEKKGKTAELYAGKDKAMEEQSQSYRARIKQINAAREESRAVQLALQRDLIAERNRKTRSELAGVAPTTAVPVTDAGESTPDQTTTSEEEPSQPAASGTTERTPESIVLEVGRPLTMRGLGSAELTEFSPVVLTTPVGLTMRGLGDNTITVFEPVEITITTPLTIRGVDP